MGIQKTVKTALLVIDVQQGLFEKSTPIFRADKFLENILDLINRAHNAGAVVVYIQHADQKYLIKGSDGWCLHARFDPQPHDWHVDKTHGNAFEATNLDELLKAEGVKRVVAAGLVTHGCVKRTCLGALNAGYQVILAADAHSSYSKDAAEMIGKWNKLLAGKGVVVIDSREIVFS